MHTAFAFICCTFAALCFAPGVNAVQWQRAVTDDVGGLFYPSVELSVSFFPASDVRLDASGVTDQTLLRFRISTFVSATVLAGGVGNWEDAVAPPPPSSSAISIENANSGAVLAFINQIAPANSWLTLRVTGNSAQNNWAVAVVFEKPRWFQARTYSEMAGQPGVIAWISTSLFFQPQPGDRTANLYLPIPHPNDLINYVSFAPVKVNITVGDDASGDFADPVGFYNASAPRSPSFGVTYFTLAPFLYRVSISNNQGYMHDGSIFVMLGTTLDPNTGFSCVWNNTRSGLIDISTPTFPSSNVSYSCVIPTNYFATAMDQDMIQLVNVSLAILTPQADPHVYGYLPFAVPGVYQFPTWRYQKNLPVAPSTVDLSSTGGDVVIMSSSSGANVVMSSSGANVVMSSSGTPAPIVQSSSAAPVPPVVSSSTGAAPMVQSSSTAAAAAQMSSSTGLAASSTGMAASSTASAPVPPVTFSSTASPTPASGSSTGTQPIPPSPVESSSTGTEPPQPPNEPHHGGLSGGAKAGIAISVLLVFGVAAGGAFYWRRRQQEARSSRALLAANVEQPSLQNWDRF